MKPQNSDSLTEATPNHEMEMQDVKCPECDGTGAVDSGGVTPWGAGIDIPCPRCSSWTPERLRQWRHDLGITQREAARRLGKSPRMYRYYEAGDVSIGRTLAALLDIIAGPGPTPR